MTTIQLELSFLKTSIGVLILEDLKETAEGLYRHLMKGDNKSEDLVAEKITQDIHEHFSGGYNIIWNDTLNHFLVNFNIVWILKKHIGNNSWSDVPMEQRELFYRGYNGKYTLPNWNIEQEGYWIPDQPRYWTRRILMIWSIKKYSDQMKLMDLFYQECASCVSNFFKLWIIWFTLIESFSKRMMRLGLGLGWGLELGSIL